MDKRPGDARASAGGVREWKQPLWAPASARFQKNAQRLHSLSFAAHRTPSLFRTESDRVSSKAHTSFLLRCEEICTMYELGEWYVKRIRLCKF